MLDTGLQINHILKLLDDDSPEIQKILRSTILENSLEIILNGYFHKIELKKGLRRAFNKLKNEMHFDLVYHAFQQLIDSHLEDIDLEKSVLILAYWNNPKLVVPDVISELDQMAKEINSNLPRVRTPSLVIEYINTFLYDRLNFKGNTVDYYNPDNSFIDKVLIKKTGIPISLSTLYILLAKRLGLPVVGISMPAHFIVKYDDSQSEIIFDPFFKGEIYTRDECLNFLRQANALNPHSILKGCAYYHMVLRMMRNMHLVFSSYKDDPKRIAQLDQFVELFEKHFR